MQRYNAPQARGGNKYFEFPTSYDEAQAIMGRFGDSRKKQCKLSATATLDVGSIDGDTFVVRVYDTDVVTFYPNDDIGLDSGGWQTLLTRSTMRSCGVFVSMDKGIASISHGKGEYTYVDNMRLKSRGGRKAGVSYPMGLRVVAPGDARQARARALALQRRQERKGLPVVPYVWLWPLRSGGQTPYRGNAPEAFKEA
jgi:hypothetical protein